MGSFNDRQQKTVEPQTEFYPLINRDNDYGLDRHAQRATLFSGIESVWLQDRAVTEGMGSILDRTEERLVSSDAPIVHVRRTLIAATRALEVCVSPPAESDFPYLSAIPAGCLQNSGEGHRGRVVRRG